ncbi:isoleucyl-tRNA synthetase [Saprolegnia parasitica CBS 223.65]|uniref:isoleucine--tRNA ligase n=1 Tax=Saprolegnia parasitica (strain CBS 223.65) TaxID=695850 RepID=A0A067BYA6_SAPPC|nr:isoleucyl-tRNA synthetase [Saprolegnia parasitica CBS 223.65]KDO21830.1 isoleucyl-tRNA synthetase [Saprolegnia parasitica CBS 223.65]|eukprot:XP_012207512.1 isoleucyl-tRNA synthetase [Saprolegnia parasitica CBS 223.65]
MAPKPPKPVGDVVRKTLNLPKTEFPMRANATVREPQLHARCVTQLYAAQAAERSDAPTFLLHDGPPFANGSLHTGHFLNRVLKDMLNRYKLQRGYKIDYIPGWDCHGLPIEIKALERLKDTNRDQMDPAEIRRHSRELALEAIAAQKKDLQRWGVLADWSGAPGTAYHTMDPSYEVKQYDVFKKMSELEYNDEHTSQSAYIRFRLKAPAGVLSAHAANATISAVIWTTTPWTIPANRGLCFRSDLTYALIETAPGAYDLVAQDLVETYASTILQQHDIKIVATFSGADVLGNVFANPLDESVDSIALLGGHVTTDAGTGVVHTAPAHGQEDYQAWMAHHAQFGTDNSMTCLVDGKGKYTAEAGPHLAGLFVQTKGTAAVLEALSAKAEALVHSAKLVHRYPYDWRTKKPIILRATKQWFAKLDTLHALGHDALNDVAMHPKSSRRRLEATLSSRNEWCISRQRAWGVPIPVFYDVETDEPLLTTDSIEHVQRVMAANGGSDAWWTLPLTELLPPGYDPAKFRKGMDTLDVWFDSGSSWLAVLDGRPADIYLEGSDQHRGWFQSSLLTSLAVQKKAPYKQIITHGFILDERGQKMSKSLGNVLVPSDIIDGKKKQNIPAYGVDTMRFWVATTDYTNQVSVGPSTMVKVSDSVRKVRNTARFLLANLNDFDPRTDMVPYEDLTPLDQYMLHLLSELQTTVTDGYETFAFNKVQQALAHFIATDLSAFYMEACKDRLYCEAPQSPLRRSTQTVLEMALRTINTAIAPVICHTAEDIRMHRLAQYTKQLINDVPGSVFLDGWFHSEAQWHNPALAKDWDILRQLRFEVNRVVEAMRDAGDVKTTLECNVHIGASPELLAILARVDGRVLEDMMLCSGITLTPLTTDASHTLQVGDASLPLHLTVTLASGHKCPRCWKYSPDVDAAMTTLCERCAIACGHATVDALVDALTPNDA